MYDLAKEIVNVLNEKGKYISTMESCTGGSLVNAITSIPNASNIIKYSAITYSNEFKIKMGVSKKIIDKYSVYSKEVSIEMAKAISKFTDSNYGIGVTGKLCKSDLNNPYGEDNQVFYSIYDKDNDKVYSYSIFVNNTDRIKSKEEVTYSIFKSFIDML